MKLVAHNSSRASPALALGMMMLLSGMPGCADVPVRTSSPRAHGDSALQRIVENPDSNDGRSAVVTGEVVEVLPGGSLRIGPGGRMLVVAFESKGLFPQVNVGDLVRVSGVVDAYRDRQPIDPGPEWNNPPGGPLLEEQIGPDRVYDEFYDPYRTRAQIIADSIEVIRP